MRSKFSLWFMVYGLWFSNKRCTKSPPMADVTINQLGQSLIEVIVASAVGILVVTALTFATIFSLRNASFAKNSAQATKLAQEGIERARSGRDRNAAVSISGTAVAFWDGNSSIACSGQPNLKSDSIWCYQITKSAGCDNPKPAGNDGKCYFSVSSTGALTNIGFGQTSFPTSSAVNIPGTIFKRAVLLSDDANYQTQKKVTVVVTWRDFAGDHESKLTTILRKL